MTIADLPAIAADMRGHADASPWNPYGLKAPGASYSRFIELEGYRFRVTLTRTNTPKNSLYMLSIGEPALVPERLVQAVRAAILPGSTDLGEGALGASRQFVQRIEEG